MYEKDSHFIGHEACPICGSSDGVAVYNDGGKYCFVHGQTVQFGENKGNEYRMTEEIKIIDTKTDFIEGVSKALDNRLIPEDVCQRWGYQMGSAYNRETDKSEPCQIANFYSDKGRLIGQKLRFKTRKIEQPDGEIKSKKVFASRGNTDGLYGKHLWNKGKQIIITEGELDALTIDTVSMGKWPVVSIPHGAKKAAKVIASELEYLNNFEKVLLCFDNDDEGRAALEEVCEILPVGKAFIVTFPLKDASEMLVKGRADELVDSLYKAKEYTPDGIVNGLDLWEEVCTPRKSKDANYWVDGMNKLTRGLRTGELVTLCAGSGVGKSAICKEIAYDLAINQGFNVGIIALEESTKISALSIMSLYAEKRLHLEDDVPKEDLKKYYDATLATGRFLFYDHWGSVDESKLFNKIYYLAKAKGCKFIFLDHLSIVVSGIEEGDERRIIDNLMTRLRKMVEELDIGLILVSHLRKTSGGKSHETGGDITLDDLRGSGSIKQLSDIVIAVIRNQQDAALSHISTVKILKNRFSGETGATCYLAYNPATGRLLETVEPVSNTFQVTETEGGGDDF